MLTNWTDGAKGIDTSKWNGRMNWQKARTAGISFAFIKASEFIADSEFAHSWPAAKDAGILRGAYHYFRWTVNPVKQAELFLTQLRGDPGELPPCCDFESKSYYPSITLADGKVVANKVACEALLWQFIAPIIKELNIKPFIYTGYYTWTDLTPCRPGYSSYSLWLPWYAKQSYIQECTKTGSKTGAPPPWKEWEIWQYSDKASNAAYGGDGAESQFMDLDVFNGTEEELRAKYGSQVVTTPPILTIDERVARLETEARLKGWNV
jgi:lysozyme